MTYHVIIAPDAAVDQKVIQQIRRDFTSIEIRDINTTHIFVHYEFIRDITWHSYVSNKQKRVINMTFLCLCWNQKSYQHDMTLSRMKLEEILTWHVLVPNEIGNDIKHDMLLFILKSEEVPTWHTLVQIPHSVEFI